jgi:hypothetical protein
MVAGGIERTENFHADRFQKERGAMSKQDTEIAWLKAHVNCAALLERLPLVWRFDRAESTRRSLKYRRGEGPFVFIARSGALAVVVLSKGLNSD